jgi:hypothetical protein
MSESAAIRPSWWYGSIGVGLILSGCGLFLYLLVNGRSGKSVLEFQAKESGNYLLACDYAGESKGPEVVLAVGSGVGERIGGTVLRSLAAMFGGGASGGTVILVLCLMRDKAKKRLAAQTNPQAHSSSIS